MNRGWPGADRRVVPDEPGCFQFSPYEGGLPGSSAAKEAPCQQIILWFFMVALVIAGLCLPAPGAETPSPPSISVDADGKVTATPDLARLILEVETQAATAVAAGQENAKQADRVLTAVKPGAGARGQGPDPGLSPDAGALL